MASGLMRLALALATGMAAQPAWADWTHERSGITIPDVIGDMKRGDTRDTTGTGSDVMLQYGSGPTLVTVYVYQSAFPNPALWYRRTLTAMGSALGTFDAANAARDFTIANAPRPNARRAAFDLWSTKYKATAVAFAQVNHWMVKIRITSETLDRAGVDARMDELLGAIRFDRPAIDPVPLTVPAPCDADISFTGKPLDDKAVRKLIGPALVTGMMVDGDARGHRGLAREPEKWCETKSGLPATVVSTFRQREGLDFVVLLGDAGLAVESRPVDVDRHPSRIALYGSNTVDTKLIWIFDAMPDVTQGTMAAVAVLSGKSQSLGASAVADAQGAKSKPEQKQETR